MVSPTLAILRITIYLILTLLLIPVQAVAIVTSRALLEALRSQLTVAMPRFFDALLGLKPAAPERQGVGASESNAIAHPSPGPGDHGRRRST